MTDINWDEQPTPEHLWLEWKVHGYASEWVLDKKDYYADRYSRILKAGENIDYTIHRKPEPKAFEPAVGKWCEIDIDGRFRKTEIIAILDLDISEGLIVVYTTPWNPHLYTDSAPLTLKRFRPIKSDKELFIEKAKDICQIDDQDDSFIKCLGLMYEAGFKAPSED